MIVVALVEVRVPYYLSHPVLLEEYLVQGLVHLAVRVLVAQVVALLQAEEHHKVY